MIVSPEQHGTIQYGIAGFRIYVANHCFVNYEYVHDDYDGAEDSHDNRHGHGESVETCKAEIDERFYE